MYASHLQLKRTYLSVLVIKATRETGRKQGMKNNSPTKELRISRSGRMVGLGLLVWFSYSGPLWAPAGPGWCKNNTFITTTANLSFGSFSTDNIGLINITPAGVRNSSGGVVLMGGTVSAGIFSVAGCANYAFSIILPPTTTLTFSTSTMTVSTYQTDPTGSGVTDATGNALIKVGATLNVGLPQPAGPYTGTFIFEIVLQ